MAAITPWYIAVEPFDPSFGEKWTKYIELSKLPKLKELVSFDRLLCPCVIKELVAEDWSHNVHEDFATNFFRNLEYLLERVSQIRPVNVLAAVRNLPYECRDAFRDPRFEFKGYDLVEIDLNVGTSALTNGGGYFSKAFRSDELNDAELITAFDRADEINYLLKVHYPYELHAQCHVWALWKMKNKLSTGN